MSERYLWDKTGEPDQEIEELEALLGVFAFNRKHTPVEYPAAKEPLCLVAGGKRSAYGRSRSSKLFGDLRPIVLSLSIAAALLILIAGGALVTFNRRAAQFHTGSIETAAVDARQAQVDNLGERKVYAEDIVSEGRTGPEIAIHKPGIVSARNLVRVPRHADHQEFQTAVEKDCAFNKQRQEAHDARAKLVLAIRVATDKLDQVNSKLDGASIKLPVL